MSKTLIPDFSNSSTLWRFIRIALVKTPICFEASVLSYFDDFNRILVNKYLPPPMEVRFKFS